MFVQVSFLILICVALISQSRVSTESLDKISFQRHLLTMDDDQLKSQMLYNDTMTDIDIFYNLCRSIKPASDKASFHRFSQMYGELLIPYIRRKHQLQHPIKFFEIGLGCGKRAHFASVKMWKALLHSKDELWMGEYDAKCVIKLKHMFDDFQVLVGDQGNVTTLNEWIQQSKGGFDIIIDDGGHTQNQMIESFTQLWPEIKPGGLYFIEDMQVTLKRAYRDLTGQNRTMMNYIHKWNTEMILHKNYKDKKTAPRGIAMISCQFEACVIRKCGGNTFTESQFCT